jgi:HAD superfamily hydrolase (TIGR01509 family)
MPTSASPVSIAPAMPIGLDGPVCFGWVTATAILIFGKLIRAIVFDFDGLILDTEEPIYRSWLEVYEAHGEDLPFDRWVLTVGSTDSVFHPQHHLEEKLGRPLAEEVLTRRRDRRTEMILANHVLPGVVQRLDEAREIGLKLGVASSSTREWVSGHLARLGILDRFDCLRCRDDVANAKPEPDLYLAVLACLGVGAGESVAIEDSPNGVAAAKRAGMKCVAIPNSITARLDLSHADLILNSLAELTVAQLLKRLSTSA